MCPFDAETNYAVLTRACGMSILLIGVRIYIYIQAEITERTMSDGSLPRILLRAGNFNSALPPSELRKVSFCQAHLWWLPDLSMGSTRLQFPGNRGSFSVRSSPEDVDHSLSKQTNKHPSSPITEKVARSAQAFPVLGRHQATTLTRPYHSLTEQC